MALLGWEGEQSSSLLLNRLNAPASPQVSGHCVTQRPCATQVGVLTVTLAPMILPQASVVCYAFRCAVPFYSIHGCPRKEQRWRKTTPGSKELLDL